MHNAVPTVILCQCCRRLYSCHKPDYDQNCSSTLPAYFRSQLRTFAISFRKHAAWVQGDTHALLGMQAWLQTVSGPTLNRTMCIKGSGDAQGWGQSTRPTLTLDVLKSPQSMRDLSRTLTLRACCSELSKLSNPPCLIDLAFAALASC